MSIRTLPGTFISGTILQDALPPSIVANSSFRTLGSYRIEELPINPAVQKAWTIESITITARLYVVVNLDGSGSAPYGKFGKIIAGIAPNTPATPQGNFFGASGIFNPPDQSLTADLWNPAVEDLPPVIDSFAGGPTAGLAVSCTVTPPVPLVAAQANFGVFIAIMPSLLYNALMTVGGPANEGLPRPSWSFLYDDGTTLT